MPIGLDLSVEVKFVVRNMVAFGVECWPVIPQLSNERSGEGIPTYARRRKRACLICRPWLRPDPLVGVRASEFLCEGAP